jgi:hypothetical protein
MIRVINLQLNTQWLMFVYVVDQNPEQPGRVEQPDSVRAEQRLRDAAAEDAEAVGQQPHAVGGGAQRSRTVSQESQPEGLSSQDGSNCL